MMSQKDAAAVGMGPTVSQVISERSPDFVWQGHHGAFTPFGVYRQSTFMPVDIVQREGRYLYSTQSKPCKDRQYRVVTSALGGVPSARSEQALHLRGGEIFRHALQANRHHARNAVREVNLYLAAELQVAQKRTQCGAKPLHVLRAALPGAAAEILQDPRGGQCRPTGSIGTRLFTQKWCNYARVVLQGSLRKTNVLSKVAAEILLYLSVRTQNSRQWHGADIQLSHRTQKSAQGNRLSKAQRAGASTIASIKPQCLFVQLINSQPTSFKPSTQVGNQTKRASGCYAGKPLLDKTRRVLVNVGAQGAFVQAADNGGARRGIECSSSHVFSPQIDCLEKTENYAGRLLANLSKNSVDHSKIRHSSTTGIVPDTVRECFAQCAVGWSSGQ